MLAIFKLAFGFTLPVPAAAGIDRQAARPTDRRTGGYKDRQTESDRKTDSLADELADRRINRQTGMEADRKTESQTAGQTGRKADRQSV